MLKLCYLVIPVINNTYKKGVGKSSILLRFVTNEFKDGTEYTLGAAFMS